VIGASLATLFLQLNVQAGVATIIIAHVMFNISYVVVTVRARLRGFDWTLEEAAMDLGANEFQTFRKVTLPLIFPGILAAALLAFALSIDDYVITSFVAGHDTTFPLWVFGVSRLGVPPEVNVLGTLIFGIALVFIAVQVITSRRESASAMAGAAPGSAPAVPVVPR
jgi:spermidine/putrescine transport system permease protein